MSVSWPCCRLDDRSSVNSVTAVSNKGYLFGSPAAAGTVYHLPHHHVINDKLHHFARRAWECDGSVVYFSKTRNRHNQNANPALETKMGDNLKRQMDRVVRKPDFCICENKDADQLRGNREADQRLCFRYTESTVFLLPKFEIPNL